MKIKLVFLFFFILISCKDDDETLDCSAVTCEAVTYQIRLIDNSTGANIILTEQLTESEISITNDENEQVEAAIINGEIIVFPKDGISGDHNLTFRDIRIEYSYIFEGGGSTCCDFGNLSDVNVTGSEFEVNENLLAFFLNL